MEPGALGIAVGCTLGNAAGVISMITATFGLFIVPVSEALGWPRAQFSGVLFLMAIIGVVGYPLAGRAVDRFGIRPVAIIGRICFGLSVALLYFTNDNLLFVYGLYAILGCTSAFASIVVLSKPIPVWFSRHRGLMFAITGAFGINAGAAIMQMLLGSLIPSVGWRDSYLVMAGIALIVGLPAMLLLRERPQAPSPLPAAKAPATGNSLREVAQTPVFWALLVGVALGAGALTATVTHIVPILHDRAMAPSIATMTFVTMTMCNALWQVLLGTILDRTPTPRIASAFLLVSLAGVYLLATATDPVLLLAGGALLGIGTGTEYALLPFVIPRYFGVRSFGAIYGVIYGISALVAGFTPMLADLAFDVSGNYFGALSVAGAAIVVSAGLIASLPAYGGLRARTVAKPVVYGKPEASIIP